MTVLHLKGIMQCILIFTLAFGAACVNQILVPEIETNPSSLLVPIGTTAVFECKIRHCPRACSAYWFINGSSTAHIHQQNRHEERGFIFKYQHNTTTNVYLSTLAINASVGINNTQFQCVVQDVIHSPIRSDWATLIVASETSLAPNPSVKTISPNSTSFLLEWSSPFLWPGYHIEHFNIIVTNLNDDRVILRTMINASFDDIIVSLTVELELDTYSIDLCTCTEFLFTIFAIGPGLAELSSFSVTGRYLSPCNQQLSLVSADINTTVLFTRATTPIVEIKFNLPLLICEYQMVNYTIGVVNETVDKSNDSILYYYGPYLHFGPGMVRHAIASGLERDKEYSIVVEVWIESQVIESHGVLFNTHFLLKPPTLVCSKSLKEDKDILHYKIAIGACLAVIVVICLTIVGVVVCLYVQKKMEKLKINDSTSRVCNSMVHNPIYDGPVYESVQTQFETLTKQATSTSNTSACNSQPSTPTSSEKSIRYVDPPSSAQQVSQIRSKSFMSHPSAPEGDVENIPRSTSVTVPITMKSGKQRNKLHLTLTLTGTDSTVATGSDDHNAQNNNAKPMSAVNPIVLRDVDDNYAVMSPAAGHGTVIGMEEWSELSPEDTDKYKE